MTNRMLSSGPRWFDEYWRWGYPRRHSSPQAHTGDSLARFVSGTRGSIIPPVPALQLSALDPTDKRTGRWLAGQNQGAGFVIEETRFQRKESDA